MFADALKVNALLVSSLGYVMTSAIAMAIVAHFWVPNGMVDPQGLNRLTESDISLLLWQAMLGNLLGIGVGYIACRLSGSKGLRNSRASNKRPQAKKQIHPAGRADQNTT